MVIEINGLLSDQPELINDKPYETWIFKAKMLDPRQVETLKNEKQYVMFVGPD